jgi:hypothetical protein
MCGRRKIDIGGKSVNPHRGGGGWWKVVGCEEPFRRYMFDDVIPGVFFNAGNLRLIR